MFLVEDQTVVIEQKEDNVRLYGEVPEPSKAPLHPHSRHYTFRDILFGHRYPHHYESDKQGIPPKGDWPIPPTILQEGRIDDPEWKHCTGCGYRSSGGRICTPSSFIASYSHHFSLLVCAFPPL